MKFNFKKTDKGVAGLTILLSIVTFLFVIGLLVMIFSLMGGEMVNATYDSTTGTVVNETQTGYINATGTSAVVNSALLNSVITVSSVVNSTDGTVIATANYTAGSDGALTNATAVTYDGLVNVSYSYTYDTSNGATDVMEDTTTNISGVTDWFPIFVVIGAMVVLILLTVIIITAIRGSGLMGESA